MVGAFIGYFAIQWFGGAGALVIPGPLLVILMVLLAGVGVGLLGVAIERFAYRPLRNAPRIAPLITALGISFILEDSVLLLFGGFPREYNAPAFLPFSQAIHIDGVNIDSVQLIVVGVSVVMMLGLRE